MSNSKELYCEALLRMCETQRLGKDHGNIAHKGDRYSPSDLL